MTESKGVNVSQLPPSPYLSEFNEYRSGGGYIVGESECPRSVNESMSVLMLLHALAHTHTHAAAHAAGGGGGGRRYQERSLRYFNTAPKHIYAYHGVKTSSNTGIGVSSIKTMNRRKTQRVYLPDTEDRGIGSADLSSFFIRDRRSVDDTESYYGSKRTSSKCVGGAIEEPTGIVDEKLSPIVKCCNADTGSEMLLSSDHNNKEVNIAEDKHPVTAIPQVQSINESYDDSGHVDTDDLGPMPKDISRVIKPRSKAYLAKKDTDAKFSSDSLIQHIHNLELSSTNKLSQVLVDTIENKIEREYRQLFESKSKHQHLESPSKQIQNKSVHKSTSLLKRRFEALRRSHKKEQTKNEVVVKPSSKIPSHKDVSVASDPPSLVARSYYISKPYNPPNLDPPKEVETAKNESDVLTVTEDDESGYNQGVLSMFRLWSKKIHLDESENPSEKPSPIAQNATKTKEKVDSKEEKKSQGKKFFFFKRKEKSKTQSDQTPCKNKKSVTANRCEIKDTLVHQAPKKSNARRYTKVPSKQEVITAKYEEVLCKAWLSKFITNSSESNESAKIRWNNNTYTTSSSTVFELMDNVYKDAGIVRRSKSASSTTHNNNRSTTKRVNFLQHNIEAWMIPKTITCSPMMIPVNKKNPSSRENSKNIAVAISKNKWAIDTARTFSRRIELVLHSNNISKLNNKESSDFLKIDIPKGFFSDSTNSEEHRCQMSDEQVYKIVEYETLKSKSDIKKVADHNCDHTFNEISVTVSVKDSKNNESKVLETIIKRRPTQRDVVIQGSRVSFPKRCDVIGVGIITQMKPMYVY
ncbi:hypothetical protein MSG28_015117 [Choristoneura fumiferana]|uniref:Uncharacterized protein n=1 Tax=Choristoneura fumiferana TaxID=7141 RepID=A0ACC0KYB6_CHOFU|nr:hypothetical protein MSG28_015117 [Choristoneura fumiferana]